MKKGIIVEHKKRYSIVMDRQGLFHKVRPLQKEEIGMEIQFKSKSYIWDHILPLFRGVPFKIATMAIICVLLLSPIYLWVSKEDVYAVVSIDINPSINVSIDQNFQVLKLEALNEDAEQVVSQINWQNKSFFIVSEKIIELSQNTFELSNDSPVLMAISYLHQKNEKNMMDELNQYYGENQHEMAIYEVKEAIRNEAQKEQKSMNEVAAQELEKEATAISTSSVEENEESLPDLDEEEEELIHNFYQDHLEEDEDDSDPVPVESEKSKETNDSVATLLPPQANDQARENNAIKGQNSQKPGLAMSQNKVKDTINERIPEHAKEKSRVNQNNSYTKQISQSKDNHKKQKANQKKQESRPNVNKKKQEKKFNSKANHNAKNGKSNAAPNSRRAYP
ncbi:anti-sigma-I factor RsgI family protein [Gracilibacillus dipsosauri]|uniref:anti-sigma-I factor RsgI family protein n=1 Tax=Gracilibacillus dipsosauri TaxID=178340 RepID=UPI002409E782